MKQYLDLLNKIMTEGVDGPDRTGTGTRSLFAEQIKFDLREGFPLVTTKKVFVKGVIHELLWILSGSTNVRYLQKHDVHIWDSWATESGELGPVYGQLWRKWHGDVEAHLDYGMPVIEREYIDQIHKLVEGIKTNPRGRRHIVTAWDPALVEEAKLPPCHCFFQCYVMNGELSMHLYMRSCDSFLGLPFNIASYALLLHMIAMVTDLESAVLTISFGDVHIYHNHFHQVSEQLTRMPRPHPKLAIRVRKNIDEFKFEDFELRGYDPHPAINAPVAV